MYAQRGTVAVAVVVNLKLTVAGVDRDAVARSAIQGQRAALAAGGRIGTTTQHDVAVGDAFTAGGVQRRAGAERDAGGRPFTTLRKARRPGRLYVADQRIVGQQRNHAAGQDQMTAVGADRSTGADIDHTAALAIAIRLQDRRQRGACGFDCHVFSNADVAVGAEVQ